MNTDLRNADWRALNEPFSEQLRASDPRAALSWLVGVLAIQSPALRSSNSHLVAYTDCPAAIDWLEANVASPVTTNWGQGAALLGTPWPRIKTWLAAGGAQQMMALDTLIAYRAPAENMAALAQIAAPVLPDAPARSECEATLAAVLSEQSTPRIRQAVESALAYADEILINNARQAGRIRRRPSFVVPPARPVPSRSEDLESSQRTGMRQSVQDLLTRFPPRS